MSGEWRGWIMSKQFQLYAGLNEEEKQMYDEIQESLPIEANKSNIVKEGLKLLHMKVVK